MGNFILLGVGFAYFFQRQSVKKYISFSLSKIQLTQILQPNNTYSKIGHLHVVITPLTI